MKKSWHFRSHPGLRKRKILTMSTALIALLFLFTLNVSASTRTYAQNVSLEVRNASLKECIESIRNQTGFGVLYHNRTVNKVKNINLSMPDASLEDVLDKILENTGLTYLIKESVILIREVPEAMIPSTQGRTIAQPEPERREISGKVTMSDGTGLPGASVFVKGSIYGVATDLDGNYNLRVSLNDNILVFSYIGMKTREVSIDGRSLINIVLEDEITELGQVVVTGIFLRQADTYTGSAVLVTADELQQFGNRNLITSLRNIEPSFNIVESNLFGSDPNHLPEIQIRGNASIPNIGDLQEETRIGMNTPLVILDGFESDLRTLLDINENDVASITILKDASATAIYGSRGANGVVVITTKKPEPGRLRISYSSDLILEVPDLSTYDLLNAREKLEFEKTANIYQGVNPRTNVIQQRYYNYLLNEVNRGVDTDWLSIPTQTGTGHRHNLRLEGGDQTFRYSASAQYNDIQGAMKQSYRQQFNSTINLSYYYRNIQFSNSLMIGFGNSSDSPYGTFSEYARLNPYWRPYDEDGNVLLQLGDPGNSDYSYNWSTLPTNPLYNASLNSFMLSERNSIVNNTSVEWTITEGLLMRAQLGLNRLNSQSDQFFPANHTNFANYSEADLLRKGTYEFGVGKAFGYDGSLNLSYSTLLKEVHSIFAGIDYNMRQNQSSNYSFLAEGFLNENVDFLSMALQYAEGGKPSGSEALSRAIGITSNINYTYDNRYYADLVVRTDGSSQFGSEKRFAPFWSFGLGWNIHREDFFTNVDIIDRLRLRSSFGTSGSQNFATYQALSTYRYFTDDRYFQWIGNYMLGLGNESLQWQQKENYNLGLDINFFQSRVSLLLDVYSEQTDNLVSAVSLPPSSGFTSYIANIGKVKNKGFEIKASTFIIRDFQRQISWSVTGTLMHNQNELIELSQALKDAQEELEMTGGTNPNMLYREGYSINTIWVVESRGIDPGTGKEVYIDREGNPTFDWNAQDLTASGIAEPKYQGNLNTMLRYKNFSLNLSFGYRFGGQMYNQTLIDKVENVDFSWNLDRRVSEDRWLQAGDQAAFKSILITGTTQKSSRFVQDENTLRLQNVNLQYELMSGFLKQHLRMERLTLSASIADLFYLSTVRQERGITYPFTRQISFKVAASF
jgi:TonB-linked SusC/RagA family outer membrane protein